MKAQGTKIANASTQPPSTQPCVPIWTLPSGFCSGDLESSAALPSEFGKQQVTYRSLGAGRGIFHARVRLEESILFSAKMLSARPIAVLRLPRAGWVEVGLHGTVAIVEKPESYGFFLHGDLDDTVDLFHKPAELCDTVVTMISDDQLFSMLTGLRVPTAVERFLNGRCENIAMSVRMSAAIKSLTNQLVSSPYTGDMATLYENGKLLEVLAATFNELNGTAETSEILHRGERGKINAAIDLLMADLAEPPSLESLSGSVGLTQRRLSELFRLATGKTVVEWVAERKIEQSGSLLRDGEMTIKEIAFRLGYAHVATFTNQFTRRYGVPPASYRCSLRSIGSGKCKSS